MCFMPPGLSVDAYDLCFFLNWIKMPIDQLMRDRAHFDPDILER